MLKRSGPVDAMTANFKISGAQQKRPQNFHDALLSAYFKTAFMLFLLAEWQKVDYVKIMKDCIIVVGIEDDAHMIKVGANGKDMQHQIPTWACLQS